MSLADYFCADEPAHVFAYHADCLTFLRSLPDDWTHAIITDPPYGLADHKPAQVTQAITAWAAGDRDRVPDGKGFMGRAWDAFVPPPAVWDECLRVLKPGGHLAVFAGSRTVDLMGLSIRLAGFEMRDSVVAWLYASGFPKSLDVSKALDKAAGAEREVVGIDEAKRARKPTAASHTVAPGRTYRWGDEQYAWADLPEAGRRYVESRVETVGQITAPATEAAREWQGWGTALKPAHEPILLARKPLNGTVAANVLAHRTGALNIDATRVGTNSESGRWPTNVVLAHHPDCHDTGDCAPGCQVAALDEQSGQRRPSGIYDGDGSRRQGERSVYGEFIEGHRPASMYDDSGGSSRFFPTFRYQAKAPKSERPIVDGTGHPTVKPLGLMRWLVRLLVPEGGLLIDPFAGSGATLEAARLEDRGAVGIERDEHSCRLIAQRLAPPVSEEPPPAPAKVPEPAHVPEQPEPAAVEPLTLFG